MVNYDADFWQEDKLDKVSKGERTLKEKLDAFDGIAHEQDRLRFLKIVTTILRHIFNIKNMATNKQHFFESNKQNFLRKKRALVHPRYIWNFYGDFSKIKIVAKYSARIGLLLSPTRHIEWVNENNIKIEPDVERNGYEFTDGCGRMSTRLAQKFVKELRINHRYQHQRKYNFCVIVKLGIKFNRKRLKYVYRKEKTCLA